MKNDAFLYSLQQQCPKLQELQCIDNTLFLNNTTLSLHHFHIQKFFWQNKPLWKKIKEFSSEDFFNLIACHLYYFSAIDERQRQSSFFQEENFTIKKMRIIELEDKYGFIKEYAYFLDDKEQFHLLFGPPKNLFEQYKDLQLKRIDNVTFEQLKQEGDNLKTEKKYFLLQDYKQYIQKEKKTVTKEEQALAYQDFIKQLTKVKEDTIDELKKEYKNYEEFIKSLKDKSMLNQEEIKALQFYQELMRTNSIEKQERLILQKSGYLHGIFLVVVAAILGICLSVILIHVK